MQVAAPLSSPTEVGVVIAGAGPVGLALALDLGRAGIRCTVLDGQLPEEAGRQLTRANAINVRAMEYMRRLDVSAAISAAASEGTFAVLDVAFVTRLNGHEIARFINAFMASPDAPSDELSPEVYRRVNQRDIERVLREAVQQCPSVEIKQYWALDTFVDEGGQVRVIARHLVNRSTWKGTAAYLVGCDGGTSTVRKQAGIALDGEGGLAANLTITFTSEQLYDVNVHAAASQYWIVNAEINASIGRNSSYWRLTVWSVTAEQEQQIRTNPAAAIAAVAGQSVRCEVLVIEKWSTHHLLAKNFLCGRVVIAGDAAHMHPPTGGLGMNTGLGDASNIGWKLAAVLKGWGGEALLRSYDEERRPYDARVVAEANLQYGRPPARYRADGLDLDSPEGVRVRAQVAARVMEEKRSEFFSRGLVLGQTYASCAIVSELAPVINREPSTYVETAQPGARLPHRWLAHRVSIYDKLDPHGLTLVAVQGEEVAITAMCETAKNSGIPIAVIELDASYRETYQATYLLVRPDGHVSWRGDSAFSEDLLMKSVGLLP